MTEVEIIARMLEHPAAVRGWLRLVLRGAAWLLRRRRQQCYPPRMAGETDNLVLEHLRAIRSEIAGLRSETRERLDRVETRLSVIEGTLGNLYALSGSDRETIHSLARRIERIERRLQLTDQPSS